MLKNRRRKKKQKKKKVIKNIYIKFAEEEKNRVFFFCKVIGYKSEKYRNNRGLKIKKN